MADFRSADVEVGCPAHAVRSIEKDPKAEAIAEAGSLMQGLAPICDAPGERLPIFGPENSRMVRSAPTVGNDHNGALQTAAEIFAEKVFGQRPDRRAPLRDHCWFPSDSTAA